MIKAGRPAAARDDARSRQAVFLAGRHGKLHECIFNFRARAYPSALWKLAGNFYLVLSAGLHGLGLGRRYPLSAFGENYGGRFLPIRRDSRHRADPAQAGRLGRPLSHSGAAE